MSTLAIIQARMGSTRLPGKVLRPILGRPMLWHIVARVRQAGDIGQVIVATSDMLRDEPIRLFCSENNIACFAGSETDVLDRFYHAAVKYDGDPLIRITADCPFVDPEIIMSLLALYRSASYDYVSVATGAGAIFLDNGRFPDGLDAECFSFTALKRAWLEAHQPTDREHVTPYIWRNKPLFRSVHLTSPIDYSSLRWTVDHEADFQMVAQVYKALYTEDKPFLLTDILAFLSTRPDLAAVNQSLIGNEGYSKLWEGKLQS